MATIALKHFDTLGYVEKSKALGVNEEIAKHQARQFEQVFEIAVTASQAQIDGKELATRHDIVKLERDIKEVDLKIEQLRKELKIEIKSEVNRAKYEMIAWVAGMLVASGLIQHFFK